MRRRLTLLVAATTSVVLLAFLIPRRGAHRRRRRRAARCAARSPSRSPSSPWRGPATTRPLQAAVSQVQSDGLQATVYRIDGTRSARTQPRDVAVDETADVPHAPRSAPPPTAGG